MEFLLRRVDWARSYLEQHSENQKLIIDDMASMLSDVYYLDDLEPLDTIPNRTYRMNAWLCSERLKKYHNLIIARK